jgi:hypothetical protein
VEGVDRLRQQLVTQKSSVVMGPAFWRQVDATSIRQAPADARPRALSVRSRKSQRKEMDHSRFGRRRGQIKHSFYGAPYFEKDLIANRPTKKFCEIAAIPVSPSYCVKLARVFHRSVVGR